MKKAFTLIELLIVVAIIAILAAIAVPNFLEAQTRSKVSRVKADQRSIAVALESYFTDLNHYPPHYTNCSAIPACYGLNANQSLWRLTTPIAYLTSYEAGRDVFNDRVATVRGPGLPGAGVVWNTDYMFYTNYELFKREGQPVSFTAWCIRSVGPDHGDDAADWRMYNVAVNPTSAFAMQQFLEGTYDPTNGTSSVGDVLRFGGEIPPQAAKVANM